MTKKASIFTKLTLGLLVAGTMAACNQNKTAAVKPAGDSTAAAAPAGAPNSGVIVYINQDTLLSKYNYAKDMSTRLQGKGRSAQSDLDSRKQAFQREVAEYQKNANTLSAEQRAPIEQRLQRKGQELQTYEQNASAQFQNETGTETEKLFNKLVEYTKKYAKEKGYKMVLSYSKANPTILYGEETLDVTADVVKGLNDEYAKEKK
ncbi:MAG: OmpH family outer membrane protein [Mucilaginibacter sp.]